VGDIFVDVMAKVKGLPQWDADTEASTVKVLPGGSALNQARNLHALGVDVNFLGAVGDDSFGETLTRHVTKQGFSFDHVKIFQGLATSVCIVLSGPADRGFVSCYSTTDAYSTEDVEARREAFIGCTHFHIGGYFNMKGLQNKGFTAVVQRVRDSGVTVSLNLQYDAAEKWTGKDDHLRELLPLVDLLFVNEGEAAGIAKALVQPEAAPEALLELFPNLTLVITQGKDGVDVLRAGKSKLSVPIKPGSVKYIVDTTGAGDAFLAGFLSVWQPVKAAAVAQTAASEASTAPAEIDEEDLLRKSCLTGHQVAGLTVGREGACIEPVTAVDVRANVSDINSDLATTSD